MCTKKQDKQQFTTQTKLETHFKLTLLIQKDGKPGAKYDTTDNGMKPTRITTPEGKVYELVPASTKGNETGDVEQVKLQK